LDTDVLIVGAGPTGLMLANQLARHGVDATIIDRHAGPARETRALGVHARTLEIYALLGVVERALALGRRGTGANLWANGRHTARIPLGDAGRALSPYPFILILGQDDNERILGERLAESGRAVRWQTELVALEQHADHVRVSLRHADGSVRQMTAAWVAGCDGAHSGVRTLSGIAFEGAAYEHVFYVADTQATGNMVADEVNAYLWRSGFHLLFPMRGTDHWRVVGIVPEPLRGRRDLAFEDVVGSLTGESGSSVTFSRCSWFSTYRIHHRCAARFRDRRCFLLGDAAHIHSPVGAQGMNTGLQDAFNLGWKLALVIGRGARETLLDSYEAERLPVARRLLETTDRAFRLVVSDHPLAGMIRTRVIARVAALAMRRPAVQAFAFRTVSQIGIAYRDSPLSMETQATSEGPRAGDRFPWARLRLGADAAATDVFASIDDRRFTLIVVDEAAAPDAGAFGDLVQTLVVAPGADNDAELARIAVRRPAFFLLRPDGHVGCCGSRVDGAVLTRYLDAVIGVPTREP